MKYDIQEIDRNDIKIGDIILCKDSILRTVSKNNIKYDRFMGISIFGDTYRLGYEKVKKVINLEF